MVWTDNISETVLARERVFLARQASFRYRSILCNLTFCNFYVQESLLLNNRLVQLKVKHLRLKVSRVKKGLLEFNHHEISSNQHFLSKQKSGKTQSLLANTFIWKFQKAIKNGSRTIGTMLLCKGGLVALFLHKRYLLERIDVSTKINDVIQDLWCGWRNIAQTIALGQ